MPGSAGALPAAGAAGDGAGGDEDEDNGDDGDGDDEDEDKDDGEGDGGDDGDDVVDGVDGDAEAVLSQHLKIMAIIIRTEVITEDGLEQPQEVSVSAGSKANTPYLATPSQIWGKRGAKRAGNISAGPGAGRSPQHWSPLSLPNPHLQGCDVRALLPSPPLCFPPANHFQDKLSL